MDALDLPRLVVFTKGDKAPRGQVKTLYQRYVGSGFASVMPPPVTSGRNDAVMEELRVAILKIIDELKKLKN
jgi:GTP-binding protein